MRNKNILFLCIGFQLLILAGMFGKAFYPLLSNTEIRLKSIPVDPRDYLRGNYSNLRYNFNTIYLDSVKNNMDSTDLANYEFGDVVYLEMVERGGVHEVAGVWKNMPADKKPGSVYMRGIVQDRDHYYDSRILRLKGGIESYFTDVEKAEEIDKATAWNTRGEAYVTVKVAGNGTARIKDIEVVTLPDTTSQADPNFTPSDSTGVPADSTGAATDSTSATNR